MSHRHFLCSLLAPATSLLAQAYLTMPVTAAPAGELPNYSMLPLMQPNARVQMFYDAVEVGSNAFIADELALRYDGPIPQVGAPGPFTIQRLRIRVGASSIAAPGADFAANLTAPLATVFDGPWSYLPDDGSVSPHAFGGPSGTLTFPFTAPAPIALNPSDWFVVELIVEGNNIASFGFAHAMLDGASTTGGVSNGTAAAVGLGCSAGAGLPNASASSNGTFAPGAVHFLTGQHLGANALAIAIFGLSNPMLPLPASTCTLLASPDLTAIAIADGAGAITGQTFALAVPASSAISGVAIYEQLASLVQAANPLGLVLSSGVAVQLGSWTALGRGTYSVAHDTAAGASFANVVRPFGYALRLRTL